MALKIALKSIAYILGRRSGYIRVNPNTLRSERLLMPQMRCARIYRYEEGVTI